MQHRKAFFTAWSLAALMVATAGCDSSDNPVGPPDTVAPMVSATNPIDGTTGVAVITATFNEAMMSSSISTASFAVSGPGVTPITGVVTYNATTHMATFTPTTALAPSTGFTATVTTGVRDASGNALVGNKVWTFTSSPTASNQLSVALGGAGAFAVLAGSTITSTGATALTGDLGVSPAPRSPVSSGTLTGVKADG
jgi:hypothetical protein